MRDPRIQTWARVLVDYSTEVRPGETVAITGGVLAGAGDLDLALVILAASTGAIAGDNVSYAIGTWLGEHTLKRWFRSDKARGRLEWAERQLQERGGYLIVVARFIPGGRTAVTFACGYLRSFRWRRFIAFDVVAGLVWGSYTALLGYVGGKTFEQDPWKGLLIAFAIAIVLAGGVELVRHRRRAAARGAG